MICKHCGYDIEIRNPSVHCDHIYYPENCDICEAIEEIAKLETLKKNLENQIKNK